MQNIKIIELLPQFFVDVKKHYATVDLKNGKFVVALMADFIPRTVELQISNSYCGKETNK